jgi:hypothetical protein
MTKYIVIDTEGTGLFRARNTLPDGRKVVARSHEPGQPRMAEYAHVLLDEDFELEDTYQQYVLPVGWRHGVLTPDGWRDGEPMLEMPPEAYEKNKLSMDFLRANGLPISQALFRYADAMRTRAGWWSASTSSMTAGRSAASSAGQLCRTASMKPPAICAMRSIGATHQGQDQEAQRLRWFSPADRRRGAFRHTRLRRRPPPHRAGGCHGDGAHCQGACIMGALLPAAVHKLPITPLFEGATA